MFDVKLEGLGQLQKQLEELADAAQALDGNLCELRFEPQNEESVRDAITQMEASVDNRIAKWRGNPGVRDISGRRPSRPSGNKFPKRQALLKIRLRKHEAMRQHLLVSTVLGESSTTGKKTLLSRVRSTE